MADADKLQCDAIMDQHDLKAKIKELEAVIDVYRQMARPVKLTCYDDNGRMTAECVKWQEGICTTRSWIDPLAKTLPETLVDGFGNVIPKA